MTLPAAKRQEFGRERTDKGGDKGGAAAPDRTWRSKVFISYCHRDADWLSRLLVHFKPLERYRVIERWDDSKIAPGHDWQEEIRGAIDSARVAILLVSADFIASEFITRSEVPMLLDAARADGLLILPVIIRPCRMPDSLAKYQAVNSPQRTLEEMEPAERERVFVRLVETVIAWMHMSKSERVPVASRAPSPREPSAPSMLPPVGEPARVAREPSGRQPSGDRWRMEEMQRDFARRVMETPAEGVLLPPVVRRGGPAEPMRSGSILVNEPGAAPARRVLGWVLAGMVTAALIGALVALLVRPLVR